MKKFEIILLIVGIFMLGFLIKKMNPDLVFSSISKVGFGFIIILAQEITAYIFNALGWKFAFYPEISKQLKFKTILKTRIAGDGVNYLTPSATFAGEFARAMMVGSRHPIEHRLSSVAVAKINQGIAMAIISVTGILWAVSAKINFQNMKSYIKGGGWLLLGILAVIAIIELRAAKLNKNQNGKNSKTKKLTLFQRLKQIDTTIMLFFRKYPLRFILSISMFLCAYIWGMVEVYLICKFLGFDISLSTALLIEMLSVFMDGLFFAVPGKAGTQEATKTAIFAALGYDPRMGFAFGIIRHLREITWAVTGFSLYYQHKKS
jgi:hypothetical protein